MNYDELKTRVQRIFELWKLATESATGALNKFFAQEQAEGLLRDIDLPKVREAVARREISGTWGLFVAALMRIADKAVEKAGFASDENERGSAALGALAAAELDGNEDFKAGMLIGAEQGEEWASFGQGLPTKEGLQLIARGRASHLGASDRWRTGFEAGYVLGFAQARADGRPATAGNGKYDQPSYWAGYKAGLAARHIVGDERARMHRSCDLEINAHGYKRADYDAGFVAGDAEPDRSP